jgi:hypothetical protein
MHSHQKHRHSGHKRAQQFMRENRGGTCTPKKKVGGAVGHPARGNNSESDMRRGSAEASDTFTEGVKRSKRIPRKTGGKVPKIKVDIHGGPHLHVHSPLGPQAAAGAMAAPQGAPIAGPPPGPGAGLPVGAPGVPGRPPFRKGGKVSTVGDDGQTDISDYREARHFGAATGMGRKFEFEKLKREGH